MTLSLAEPDRARFVDVTGARLRVWEWGDPAAPAVLCLHGAYDHGRMWDHLAPQIAGAGFHVIAVDIRGHGDSDRLRSGHVWAASVMDVARLARHYGPPVGLIGHSFGGGQALMVAATFLEQVRWVVNIDGLGPPASMFEEERDLAAVAAAGVASAERVLRRPARVYASREEMAERRGGVNVRLPAEWLAHLVTHGTAGVEGGFVWKSDPMFSVGFPDDFSLEHLFAEFAAVRCPVLVITGGEHDTRSDLSDADLDARVASIPDVRHHVVDGAGHYVHIERPDEVLRLVSAFISEVG